MHVALAGQHELSRADHAEPAGHYLGHELDSSRGVVNGAVGRVEKR
jgi:hypothetical protein